MVSRWKFTRSSFLLKNVKTLLKQIQTDPRLMYVPVTSKTLSEKVMVTVLQRTSSPSTTWSRWTRTKSVRVFDLKTELVGGKYFVLIFLPLDAEQLLSFKASLESFAAEGCQVTFMPFLFSSFDSLSTC